jgi:hypothetical protein
MIAYDGYKYKYVRTIKSGIKTWRCAECEGCPLKTNKDKIIIVDASKKH